MPALGEAGLQPAPEQGAAKNPCTEPGRQRFAHFLQTRVHIFGDRQHLIGRKPHLPLDARASIALVINDWNRERIWPKAYVREEEGMLAIYAETSADLEAGANDAQLAQVLSCGLGTGVQMFLSFESTLPGTGEPDLTDLPDN